MSLLSSADQDSFLSALCSGGCQPHSAMNLEVDGIIHRYRIEGDKSGSLNGWYVLFVDNNLSAGLFGSWKIGNQTTWCSKSEQSLSPRERELWRLRQQEAKQVREAELKVVRAKASEKATYLESIAQLAVADGHPYLVAKQVKPYGVKILKNMLLIPLRNASRAITSVQYITEDGVKRFSTGGEVTGSYFAIGKHKSILCICEGFATGASIFEATGFRVAVAFNAGNLAAVAKVIRTKFPDFTIIICADNDVNNDVNTGLIKAEDAAEQNRAMLAIAKFQESDLINGKKPNDFNDLHVLHGLEAVREAIEGALEVPALPGEAAKPIRKTLKDFELLIEESDDFEFLTDELLGQLAVSELPSPAIQYLVARIAKKANVPKHSLLEVINAYRNGGNAKKLGDYASKVEELNLKHAILPLGGRILIMNRDFDPVMERQLITFSAKTDFETRYCNRKIFDRGEEVGLGSYWLNHSRRAEFDGMVFSPGLDQPGYLNLWTGWGTEPKAGCCKKYLDFVFEVICSGDGDLFDYVIRWCAHLVQRPQELPETALVFRGREGVGKNTFVDPLQDIVGREHFLPLTSMNQIVGRFSGHLATALLVFCNESVWGGDKSAQGKLKSLITDSVQPIEYKGRDLMIMKSYLRVLVATNEDWAVPRGADDRRYVIIDVLDAKKGQYDYWKSLKEDMRSGGTAALMDYLLKEDISAWHPRQIPEKLQEAGWYLKIRSGSTVVQWWFERLKEGWLEKHDKYFPGDEKNYWPEKIATEDLQAAYFTHCESYKINHRDSMEVLGGQLKDWGVVRKQQRDGQNRPYFYLLPTLEQARVFFSKRFSIPLGVWDE